MNYLVSTKISYPNKKSGKKEIVPNKNSYVMEIDSQQDIKQKMKIDVIEPMEIDNFEPMEIDT